jgi:acyl-CoA dehydrogenase
MMHTMAVLDGNHWVINGRKAFATGARGAQASIVMAMSADGACMFLVDLRLACNPVKRDLKLQHL